MRVKYERTTLDNGLRVISEKLDHVRSACIGLWFKAGSRNEEPPHSGISHLIEHLTFKGTATRSAKEIAIAFDTIGGQVNAFTSKEYTCYYAKVLDEHFPTAVELLADMVLYPADDTELIEREKGVVLEEIKMYEDSPDEIVHDLLNQVVYAKHPLGRPILGTAESVSQISLTDIQNYRRAWYTPSNLVVAVAGNVEHSVVVEQISRYFGSWTGQTKQSPDRVAGYLPGQLKRHKDIEQAHLCLGVRGLSRGDKRKYALFLLDSILGGGMSSRLFQELREERGLVYSTYSYHASYHDVGTLGIYAATGADKAQLVTEVITKEIDDLATNGVSESELNRSKQQLKGSLMLSLENTSGRMGRLGKGELFGEEIKTPNELIEIINQTTLEDVNTLAKEILGQPVSTALVLPEGKGDQGNGTD